MRLSYHLLLVWLVTVVHAATNQTVPFNDTTRIVRSGTWSTGALPAETTICGAWTQDIFASIAFNFTGTAVYVNGLRCTDTTRIATLDGVNLTQFPPGQLTCGETMYAVSGLHNVEHTLVITFIGPIFNDPPGTQQSLVVQNIMFEMPDTPTSTSTSFPTITPTKTPITPHLNNPTKRKIPAIIGGTMGAVLLALLALLTFLKGDNLWYLLVSLWFALFGWWFIGRRRLVIRCDKDVPPTDVAFFLSTKSKIEDSNGNEGLLVWQTGAVGHARRGLAIECPIYSNDESSPHTMIGFGSVRSSNDSNDKTIKHEFYSSAPAIWVDGSFNEPQHGAALASTELTLTNRDEVPMHAVVGTHDTAAFRPFFDAGEIEKEKPYPWPSRDLYLHAFRTHHHEAKEGYSFKDFVSGLMAEFGAESEGNVGLTKLIRKENLTPEGGIHLCDLNPISHWLIEKADNDELKLRIVKGLVKGRSEVV